MGAKNKSLCGRLRRTETANVNGDAVSIPAKGYPCTTNDQEKNEQD